MNKRTIVYIKKRERECAHFFPPSLARILVLLLLSSSSFLFFFFFFSPPGFGAGQDSKGSLSRAYHNISTRTKHTHIRSSSLCAAVRFEKSWRKPARRSLQPNPLHPREYFPFPPNSVRAIHESCYGPESLGALLLLLLNRSLPACLLQSSPLAASFSPQPCERERERERERKS